MTLATGSFYYHANVLTAHQPTIDQLHEGKPTLSTNTRHVIAGIILYRTDFDLLRRCVSSLLRQELAEGVSLRLAFLDNDQGRDLSRLEAMLVEMGATDRIAWTGSGENVGFGRGHNRLFEEVQAGGAACDYYLCVNPDSILHRDTLQALVSFAHEKGDRGLFEGRQFPIEHPKPYDKTTFETDWCSGCLLLIPSTVYRQLGGFDPAYFMYCEDVDLSWRARLEGIPCYTVPNALVHHYVFRTVRDSSFERKHMVISGYLLALKFGNRYFSHHQLNQARELLDVEELKSLVSRRIRPIPPLKLAKVKLDFDHGFHFTAPRW